MHKCGLQNKNFPRRIYLGGRGAEVSYLDNFHIYSSPVYTEVLEFALIHSVA